jgi:hypothetical protein
MKTFCFCFALLVASSLYATTKSYRIKGEGKGLFTQVGTDTQSVFFRLPPSAGIASARLKLSIESSAALISPSGIKILAAGTPVGHISLGQTSSDSTADLKKREVTLSIPTSLLKNKVLKLDFAFVNLVDKLPCIEDKAGAGMIRVTEASALELEMRPDFQPGTGDFLILLPEMVNVALPAGELTPDEFKTAFQIAALAESYGSTVTFTRSINDAHIAIGVASELNRQSSSGWELVQFNGRTILSTGSDAFDSKAIGANLEHLMSLNETSPLKTESGKLPAFLFRDDLGLAAQGYVEPGTHSWTIPIGHGKTLGLIPQTLDLSMIATQQVHRDVPSNLYVYLGDDLLYTTRITKSETPQQYHVDFPSRIAQYPTSLKIKVKHHDPHARCGSDEAFVDARLLPDTKLTFSDKADVDSNFASFAYESSKGYSVVATADMLTNPEGWIHQLNYLRKVFNLNVDSVVVTKSAPQKGAILKLESASTEATALPYQGHHKITNLKGKVYSIATVQGSTLTLKNFGGPFQTTAIVPIPDISDVFVFTDSRVELLDLSQHLTQVSSSVKDETMSSFLWRHKFYVLAAAVIFMIILGLFLRKR